MTSLANRYFAIAVTIVIFGSTSNSFSINRKEPATVKLAEPAADQSSQESYQSLVKDELSRPNDIKDSNHDISKVLDTNKSKIDEIVNTTQIPEKVTPEVSIDDIKLPSDVMNKENNNIVTLQDTKNSVQKQETTNVSVTVTITTAIKGTENDITPTDQLATDSETTQSTSTISDVENTTSDATATTDFVELTEFKTESNQVNDVSKTILTTEEKVITRNTKTPEREITEQPSPFTEAVETPTETVVTTTKIIETNTDPSWKKYVTIERKRVSSSEELSTKDTDKVNNDQVISADILVQPLTEPPLERSSRDLIDTKTKTGIDSLVVPSISKDESKFSDIDKSTPLSKTDDDMSVKSISTVDTKRAGFLDLSRPTFSDATTKNETTIISISKPDAPDNEELLEQRVVGIEPQSQMDDDAINAELPKERALSDKKDNIYRFNVRESSSIPTPVEDNLSVQPINQERRTTLYTISPNYKPMKKIDVQPSKPFVRDPDDNSWRNESISSLGIVFKPKNATKSFKEVLKIKTETEFNNITENKDSKSEEPDLRVRLEKIAEVRKTKKMRVNKVGDVVYTDYEENNSGEKTTIKIDSILDIFNTTLPAIFSSTTPEQTTPMIPLVENKKETTTEDLSKMFEKEYLTTKNPKKSFNEYYDTTDEYDSDYVTLPKIDLKKYTHRYKNQMTTNVPVTTHASVTTHSLSMQTRPTRPMLPDRKPTIQYFPPRTTQKVNFDHYDDAFQRKVNHYTSKELPKEYFKFTIPTEPEATKKPEMRLTAKQKDLSFYQPDKVTTNVYMMTPLRVASPDHGVVVNDGGFNRGQYIIKHYKDFINEEAKSLDYERASGFVFTPPQPASTSGTESPPPSSPNNHRPSIAEIEDYVDYDSNFRRDVLDRFVDNFNQNSERFKIDFPVLYNNSVVHQKLDEQGHVLASSSAFMKRLYASPAAGVGGTPGLVLASRGCEPTCENNATVELSPAYELHYYVPEQEEREEPDVNNPNQYRL